MNRRDFLLAASATITAAVAPAAAALPSDAQSALQRLEEELGGRLGLFALDTGSGAQLAYRADERFPMCSTFKAILGGAILARSMRKPALLQWRMRYSTKELVTYSPVTEKHLEDGMTVAQLCAAAIQHSDNTAANLLMLLLGGPRKITAFARSLGDAQFQLERWETALNSALPGDLRDTTTPKAMATSLHKLVLGDALGSEQRDQLAHWLRGNTTGSARIRAGVPKHWQVGDKTGTGDYGSASDIGVLWRPGRSPLVLAIYTTLPDKEARARSDIIAAAAKVAARWADEKR